MTFWQRLAALVSPLQPEVPAAPPASSLAKSFWHRLVDEEDDFDQEDAPQAEDLRAPPPASRPPSESRPLKYCKTIKNTSISRSSQEQWKGQSVVEKWNYRCLPSTMADDLQLVCLCHSNCIGNITLNGMRARREENREHDLNKVLGGEQGRVRRDYARSRLRYFLQPNSTDGWSWDRGIAPHPSLLTRTARATTTNRLPHYINMIAAGLWVTPVSLFLHSLPLPPLDAGER